jgi:hypothetical protein
MSLPPYMLPSTHSKSSSQSLNVAVSSNTPNSYIFSTIPIYSIPSYLSLPTNQTSNFPSYSHNSKNSPPPSNSNSNLPPYLIPSSHSNKINNKKNSKISNNLPPPDKVEEVDCIICLSTLIPGSNKTTSCPKCHVLFCKQCLVVWFKQDKAKNKCPHCREKIKI